jgi:hypothetical protein
MVQNGCAAVNRATENPPLAHGGRSVATGPSPEKASIPRSTHASLTVCGQYGLSAKNDRGPSQPPALVRLSVRQTAPRFGGIPAESARIRVCHRRDDGGVAVRGGFGVIVQRKSNGKCKTPDGTWGFAHWGMNVCIILQGCCHVFPGVSGIHPSYSCQPVRFLSYDCPKGPR